MVDPNFTNEFIKKMIEVKRRGRTWLNKINCCYLTECDIKLISMCLSSESTTKCPCKLPFESILSKDEKLIRKQNVKSNGFVPLLKLISFKGCQNNFYCGNEVAINTILYLFWNSQLTSERSMQEKLKNVKEEEFFHFLCVCIYFHLQSFPS